LRLADLTFKGSGILGLCRLRVSVRRVFGTVINVSTFEYVIHHLTYLST